MFNLIAELLHQPEVLLNQKLSFMTWKKIAFDELNLDRSLTFKWSLYVHSKNDAMRLLQAPTHWKFDDKFLCQYNDRKF